MKSSFDLKIIFVSIFCIFIISIFNLSIFKILGKETTEFIPSLNQKQFLIQGYEILEGDSTVDPKTLQFDFIKNNNRYNWIKGGSNLLPKQKSGILWLRTKISNDLPVIQKFMLFEHSFVAFELYQDHKKFFSFSDINDPQSIHFDGRSIQLIPLLDDNSKYIYARIRYLNNKNFNYGGRYIFIGSKFEILRYIFQNEIFVLSLSLIALMIGIFSFALFLIRIKDRYVLLLEYGVFIFSSGFSIISNCTLPQILISSPKMFSLLNIVSSCLVAIFMFRIYKNVVFLDYWKILKYFYTLTILVSVALTVTAILILLDFKLFTLIFFLSILFFIILITSQFYMGTIVLFKFKNKEPSYYFLGLVFYLNMILLIIDINNELFSDTSNSLYNHWIVFFFIIIQSLLFEKEYTSYSKKLTKFELDIKSIQKELNELKLESIREKMNPIYLFSSLKFIKHLIHYNSPNTDKAILSLAGNYRFLLDKAGERFVDFEDEWKFIQEYKFLLELQYSSKLQIILNKPENLFGYSIKPLTLHPFFGYLIDYLIKIPEINKMEIECNILKKKKSIFVIIKSQIIQLNDLDTYFEYSTFSTTMDHIKSNLNKIDSNAEIITKDYKNIKNIFLQFSIPIIYEND